MNLLKCDEVWSKLVKHYEERDCIKLPEQFPPKRTRQEKMQTNIEMSEWRYGDERFIRGELPLELDPYMPAEEERNHQRRGRPHHQRPTDGGWEQQRHRRNKHH